MGGYMYIDDRAEVARAKALLRSFLERKEGAGLLRRIQVAQIVSQFDASEPQPHQLMEQALRKDSASDAVCAVLTSPLIQVALTYLGIELPLWRPFLPLLQPAAQLICEERRRTNTAVGVGLMAVGVGVAIFAAWKGGLGRPV
jgi:hypothetical protein